MLALLLRSRLSVVPASRPPASLAKRPVPRAARTSSAGEAGAYANQAGAAAATPGGGTTWCHRSPANRLRTGRHRPPPPSIDGSGRSGLAARPRSSQGATRSGASNHPARLVWAPSPPNPYTPHVCGTLCRDAYLLKQMYAQKVSLVAAAAQCEGASRKVLGGASQCVFRSVPWPS